MPPPVDGAPWRRVIAPIRTWSIRFGQKSVDTEDLVAPANLFITNGKLKLLAADRAPR